LAAYFPARSNKLFISWTFVSMITCKSEGEAVSEIWDEFVSNSPSATVSHLYGWRRIISEAYGHNSHYLMARRDGNISGILPLVHVKSRLFGNILSSMPFQDYGGIVSQDLETTQVLLDQAIRLKDELGAQSLELRQRDSQCSNEGHLRQDKVTLALDISAGSESLWKSFSPKVRNQVRKAEKSGLSTQAGGQELLEEFYRPFAVNMRDLGSPVHHPEFFKKIFSVFNDNARVMLVRESNQTIGGLIAIFYKDSAVVPWASCFRQFFSKCPNNLLYWNMFQHACARGCTSFDFGRSSIGSGTYNFKLQWGAKPFPLHWQTFSKNFSLAPTESATLQIASAVWKHLPVPFANYLGPCIRKYLTN
jgi:serine/alanine adding enzyme